MFYRQNSDQVAAEQFGTELVLIHFGRGTYFSLQHAAVDVWRQFENGARPDDVGARIRARLAAGSSAADGELAACIRTLIDEELLCEVGAAGAPVDDWASQEYRSPTVQVYSDLQELIVLDPVHEVDEGAGWPRRPRSHDGA